MALSKKEIIDYLAAGASVSREQARIMLEGLVRLAYRESHNGFVIPGLCRIEVVDREARMGRNPQTGEEMEIPAHKALRIRALPKFKEMIARVPKAPPDEEPEPQGKPVPPSMAPQVQGPIYITFKCTACGQEIEASTDMAGMEAQCPGCSAPIKVPSKEAVSELAQLEKIEKGKQEPVPEPAAEGAAEGEKKGGEGEEEWQKGSTIRIELPEGFDIPKPIKRTVYIKRRK